MRVSYFGPSGTFTEMALERFEQAGQFDGATNWDTIRPVPAGTVEPVPAGTVERVSAAAPGAALEAVRNGEVDGAVVPFENSIEGAVPATLDALVQGSRLQIVAENELDITFAILTRGPIAAADVHTICGYPHATAQVRDWLARLLPDAEIRFAASNAAAALDVAAGRADAAVSTALAGRQLNLHPFAEGISDVSDTRTRFVYVTGPSRVPPPTGDDRTTVVVEPTNAPGALHGALTEFAIRGVDLTFIESRPTKTLRGTYRFFLECSGHIDDRLVGEAIEALYRRMQIRFLGSRPAAGGSPAPRPSGTTGSRAWVDRMRLGAPE